MITHFAKHLQDHTIHNPFQGLQRLEQSLGHSLGQRLNANESQPLQNPALATLLGPAASELARLYPDPYAHALRKLSASQNNVEASQVLFDAGADSLILLALRLFCSPNDVVVTSAGSYPTFRYFAEGCALRTIEVSLRDCAQQGLEADLGGLVCAAHQHKARLVYLANPDNPTGHYHSQSEIERLRQSLPSDCVLLLDEAYLEFAPAHPVHSRVLPNTMRLRTLSKAYGLAGLRIGYAIAPADIISKADEIRTQYALSSLAQAAAKIALECTGDAKRLIETTIHLREALRQKLVARGLTVLTSATNFVCVRYAHSSISEAVQRQLFNQGIAVHRPQHPAVSQLLCVSAHPFALTDTLVDTLVAGQSVANT